MILAIIDTWYKLAKNWKIMWRQSFSGMVVGTNIFQCFCLSLYTKLIYDDILLGCFWDIVACWLLKHMRKIFCEDDFLRNKHLKPKFWENNNTCNQHFVNLTFWCGNFLKNYILRNHHLKKETSNLWILIFWEIDSMKQGNIYFVKTIFWEINTWNQHHATMKHLFCYTNILWNQALLKIHTFGN